MSPTYSHSTLSSSQLHTIIVLSHENIPNALLLYLIALLANKNTFKGRDAILNKSPFSLY